MGSKHQFITTSSDFGSQAGWGVGYALAKGHGPGVVVGPGRDNPNVFAQTFSTHAGDQYRVVAEASSVSGTDAVASVQINWIGKVGNFLSVSHGNFSVGPKSTEFELFVVAPKHAKAGVLYVVPGTEPTDVAVRYTEMGVARLSPFRDFVHYRFLGFTGVEAAFAVSVLLVTAALVRFFPKRLTGIISSTSDYFVRFFPIFAVLVCVATLFLLKGAYEQNSDAQYHQGLEEIVMRWNNFSLDLGGDAMMSFGIQAIGNPRLSPTYLLGDVVASDIRIPTEAAFQSVIMLLILAGLARRSGARFNEAFAIGLVAVGYCWIPFLSAEAITLDATLGLLWQEGAIAVLLAFYFFTRIGLGDKSANLFSAVGLAITIFWCLLTLPELIPFFMLTTLSLCVGAICAVETSREFLHKVIFSGIIVTGLLFLGVYGYVRDIFMYTAQMYYTTLYSLDFKTLFFTNTSLILAANDLGGARVYAFFGLAVIGAVCALRYGNRFARRVVFAAISLEIMIHVMSALNVVFKFVPLTFTYIERMGIPVVAMLAAAGVWAILETASFGIARVMAMATIRQAVETVPPGSKL